MATWLRLSILAVLAGIVIVVIFIGITLGSRIGKIRIIFNVIPAAATLHVDGVQQRSTTLYLSKGTHRVEVAMNGFATKTQNLDVESPQTITISLAPNSQVGLDYIGNNPSVQQQREALGGKQDSQAQANLDKYQVLINQLPFDGIDFYMSYGAAIKSQYKGPGSFALYITANDPPSRLDALDWIRQQGVDPSDAELVFQRSVNPFERSQ